jgi:hypothetical protein
MNIPMPVIALSVALAGGGAAQAQGTATPSTQAPDPVTAPREADRPPPGSKPDQALWKKAYEMNAQVLVVQHEAARLAQGVKAAGYEERLAEAGRSGAMPAGRAEELSERLRKAWMADLEAVQRPWPVSKTRVCSYELLNFESIMAPGGSSRTQLADARRALEECVGQAELVLRSVQKANRELDAAMAEVGKALAALPAKAGPASPQKPG